MAGGAERPNPEVARLSAGGSAGRPYGTPPATAEPLPETPPVFDALHDPLSAGRTEKVVVSSALSRPLRLPALTEATLPPVEPAPPSPSGVTSFQDALAAVYAQAKEVLDEDEELPPTVTAAPARPSVGTPAGVVAFLSGLPGHLSLESRYRAMEEELERFRSIEPSELVGDAAVELVALRRELHKHNAEHDAAVEATRWRLSLLEQELQRMREQLVEREVEGAARRQELLTSIDEMTGVIVFFDGYQSYLIQRETSEEPEPPRFLDDEVAMRLLERQQEDERA